MSTAGLATVRVDVWLWAARFYKTRSLAKQAIENGRVEVRGERCKPATLVRVGDLLSVRRGDERMEVDVVALSERRGPAPAAALLYAETAASSERRQNEREVRRLDRLGYSPPPARPSKRDRREIVALAHDSLSPPARERPD